MLSAQQMGSRVHSRAKVEVGGKKYVVAVATPAISGPSDKIPYRGQNTKWAELKNYV